MDSGMNHDHAPAVVERVVDSLDGAFEQSERYFATIGAGLAEAIVDFGRLTTTFETLSTSLENDDMREAADRLTMISRAIDAMAEALVGERATFVELLAINREVAERLARLQDGARTMTILTLNAKIEAARLDREEEDLSIFSIEMARTVKIAQETVDAHSSEQTSLIRLLGSACSAQADFENSHRDKIASISQELRSAFAIVDERRQRAAKVAARVGDHSKQISSAIGVAIIALQIGDNTRQRVEHVVEALRLLRSAAPIDDEAEDEATLRLVCLLEGAQLDAAASGFEDGVRHINEALEQLDRDCAAIGAQGKQICEATDGDQTSFFGVLKEKLQASQQLMGECAAASASLDEAKSAALRTLIALQERMDALEQAVNQMTLVGINAGLKSRQFGLAGLALGVIAEQLRSNAKQISCDAELLMPSLARALALARGFEEQTKTLVGIEDFEAELSAALSTFDDAAVRLDAAFASLLADSGRVNRFLSSSIVDLAPQQTLCAVLRDASLDLYRAARELPSTTSALASPSFLRSLWTLYTMEGERIVHRKFAEAPSRAEPPPPATADLDDILFA
jgi:hypothetical protein